jgi:hypothetical protein
MSKLIQAQYKISMVKQKLDPILRALTFFLEPQQLIAFSFSDTIPWEIAISKDGGSGSSRPSTTRAAFDAIFNFFNSTSHVIPFAAWYVFSILGAFVAIISCLPVGGGRHLMMKLQEGNSVVANYLALALWTLSGLVTTTFFLPITFPLVASFSCSQSILREAVYVKSRSNITMPATMLLSSPATFYQTNIGTPCMSSGHMTMMIFSAILLPFFIYISLRALRMDGDIQRFCVPKDGGVRHETRAIKDDYTIRSEKKRKGKTLTYDFYGFKNDPLKTVTTARHLFARKVYPKYPDHPEKQAVVDEKRMKQSYMELIPHCSKLLVNIVKAATDGPDAKKANVPVLVCSLVVCAVIMVLSLKYDNYKVANVNHTRFGMITAVFWLSLMALIVTTMGGMTFSVLILTALTPLFIIVGFLWHKYKHILRFKAKPVTEDDVVQEQVVQVKALLRQQLTLWSKHVKEENEQAKTNPLDEREIAGFARDGGGGDDSGDDNGDSTEMMHRRKSAANAEGKPGDGDSDGDADALSEAVKDGEVVLLNSHLDAPPGTVSGGENERDGARKMQGKAGSDADVEPDSHIDDDPSTYSYATIKPAMAVPAVKSALKGSAIYKLQKKTKNRTALLAAQAQAQGTDLNREEFLAPADPSMKTFQGLQTFARNHWELAQDEAEDETARTDRKQDEDQPQGGGKSGFCKMCSKPSDFLCSETKVPICSKECKAANLFQMTSPPPKIL